MPKEANTVHLSGEIVAFNLNPKGYPEGVVIRTPSGVAQVNYPKHGGHALRRATQLGSIVAVRAELETDEGAHPVYRVVDDEAEVSGKVAALNYSRHGNVNGYQLDDGTFVHLTDDKAKGAEFHVGDAIRVQGVQLASPDIVMLEARTVDRQDEQSAPVSAARKPKVARAKTKSLSA